MIAFSRAQFLRLLFVIGPWLFVIFLTGCATRRLPKFEPPLARSQFQSVRTTAYCHDEDDHRRYHRQSALGTTLQYGAVHSAAADWSRWPAGTMFRVIPSGEVYQVDDYGWALAGRNTLDLYVPTMREMNRWGVRRLDIEILRWGDPWASYRVLEPRRKHAHVRRMLAEIRSRY